MKTWQITDIRWATTDDLKLPFWKKWNEDNPLPNGFWQRIWEYPYVALHVPADSKTVDIGGTYPFVLFKNWPHSVSVDNRDLNKVDHPLLKNKWPKGKLIISDATKVPIISNGYDYSISISAIEEMPSTVRVLKEMIRLAKHRVVVTMDISEELGVNRILMREIEDFLGVSLPKIPHNVLRSNDTLLREYGQPIAPDYKHIRVLGLVIDSLDSPKDVGILIPHWESFAFADCCIRGIMSQANTKIRQHIYLIDDYSKDGSYQLLKKKHGKNNNITFIQIKRPDQLTNPDVGMLLDEGLKLVKEQFVAMVDADTFPLSKEWLSFSIWLIEHYHASSVGLDTGLSNSYIKMGGDTNRWWQPENGYSIRGGLYDNNWFTVTNNLFRVMRTATAKVVSEKIGYTRGHGEEITILEKMKKKLWTLIDSKLDSVMTKPDTRHPYLPVGCDNGVAANHFIDINRMGGKFNLPLTSYIGLTKADGAYGQNICNLLFHFALSTRALSRQRREVMDPGKPYTKWMKQMMKDGYISEQLQNSMVRASRKFKPGGYDNSIPTSWYTTEYKYIQTLLKEYRKFN